MIDIHTHILPAVDDGAKSFDDSLKMIQLEIENGVDTIILTPHYFKNELNAQNKDLIFAQYEKLLEKTKDLNIKLILGSEIYYSDEIMDELISNKIITLGNSKYLLIEFSLYNEYYNIPDVFLDIMALGYKVIFAHPERYEAYYKDYEFFYTLRSMGVLMQINFASLAGLYGRHAKTMAKNLLKLNLISFVGSDIHHPDNRFNYLKKCEKIILKCVGVEKSKAILEDNFTKVIKNEEIN